MNNTRKLVLWASGILAVVVFGGAIGDLRLTRSHGNGSNGGAESSDEDGDKVVVTTVKAIHPRSDPSLYISVQQLLSVEPFFMAALHSQVTGEVRDVQKAVGDLVKKGEILIDIREPDLEQQLRVAEVGILQRQQELSVAQAQAENAAALVDVYKVIIDQRRAEHGEAMATRDLRLSRYDRYKKLKQEGNIQQALVDEEERGYLASVFAVQGAEAVVRKSEADLREKESALRIAQADIGLKRSMIEVARKNRDRSRAMLDYTQITAPWDGIVTKREVDVGTFVQNASTGQSEPLLTIARDDIVTIVAKFPDNAAPFITRDTEAVIQIDELPGVKIRGKVTRFPPSIQNKDRTMRVEVDLYNDTAEKYAKFRANAIAARIAGMAADSPLALAPLAAATRKVCSDDSKSIDDPLPAFPVVSGGKQPPRLISGMSGYMRLNLQSFQDAYLIPSSAVFTRGGKPYILVVENAVSKLVPVRVVVNDGNLSKILVIVQAEMPGKGQPEVLRDLTGQEVIILNRQAEIGDGQPVKVTLENW